MENLRPDEKLEAKEFEAATRSRWQRFRRPSRPYWQRQPRLPSSKSKWLIALVIFLIILFGGRWLNHVLKNNDTNRPTTPTTTQSTTSTQATQKSQTENSSTPTNPGTNPQTGNQVPDTGPGSVAAVFLAAGIIGGSVHYVLTRQKANR